MQLDGMPLEFPSAKEAVEFVTEYRKNHGDETLSLGSEAGAMAAINGEPTRALEHEGLETESLPGMRRRKGIIIKVQSATKKEACAKLFKTLQFDVHQRGLPFLAGRGRNGATDTELAEALGLTGRMNSFTASIRRRTIAFGLKPEDVLIIRPLGSLGGKRMMNYSLSPEMIEVVNEATSNAA
jgi:hypothetical protein